MVVLIIVFYFLYICALGYRNELMLVGRWFFLKTGLFQPHVAWHVGQVVLSINRAVGDWFKAITSIFNWTNNSSSLIMLNIEAFPLVIEGALRQKLRKKKCRIRNSWRYISQCCWAKSKAGLVSLKVRRDITLNINIDPCSSLVRGFWLGLCVVLHTLEKMPRCTIRMKPLFRKLRR